MQTLSFGSGGLIQITPQSVSGTGLGSGQDVGGQGLRSTLLLVRAPLVVPEPSFTLLAALALTALGASTRRTRWRIHPRTRR